MSVGIEAIERDLSGRTGAHLNQIGHDLTGHVVDVRSHRLGGPFWIDTEVPRSGRIDHRHIEHDRCRIGGNPEVTGDDDGFGAPRGEGTPGVTCSSVALSGLGPGR